MAFLSQNAKCRTTTLANAVIIGLMTTVSIACARDDDHRSVVSKEATWTDMFAYRGSIVLDNSLVIGPVGTLDVSAQGRLLASDINAMNVRLYDSSGAHIRRLDTEECAPGIQPPTSAHFVFDDQIIAKNSNVAFLFDSDANCIRRLDELNSPPTSLCSTADTLYGFYPRVTPTIRSFSRQFALTQEYKLPPARSPTIITVSRGLQGRAMSCAESTVSYLYTDEPDARQLHGPRGTIIHYPPNYTPVPFLDNSHKDLSELSQRLQDLRRESDFAIGTFELGKDFRIVVFEDWKGRIRNSPVLLNVISKLNPEESYSVRTHNWPYASRDGKLFVKNVGGSEDRSDATNPVIEVYSLRTHQP